MDINYQSLKAQQREQRDGYSINLGLRVHRALSWLNRAEQAQGDQDAQFIFLWIAFNAAYANEIDDHHRFTEQETFLNFIKRLCELDNNNALSELVWSEFAGIIRVLLSNKFVFPQTLTVFQPFWDFQNQKKTETFQQKHLLSSK
jgi:hypothetical protein